MFVYILHFDQAISHAEHYVGSTRQLQSRLRQHATGRGSAITQHLHEAGIPWAVASIYQCTATNYRRVERQLKDNRNTPKFCRFCNDQYPMLPGAIRYDISLLDFPTRSAELATTTPVDHNDYVQIHCSQFDPKIHKMSPLDAAAYSIADKLFIATRNGVYAGHASYTLPTHYNYFTIDDLQVQPVHRLKGFGRSLINIAAAHFPALPINAVVRADHKSHPFWEAVGFMKLRKIQREYIDHYVYQMTPLMQGTRPCHTK